MKTLCFTLEKVSRSGYKVRCGRDRDGSVTIFDYTIMSGNFDEVGDE